MAQARVNFVAFEIDHPEVTRDERYRFARKLLEEGIAKLNQETVG